MYLSSGPSDRANLLLTIVIVAVGLVGLLFAVIVAGAGLKAGLVKVKRATFTRPPEHASEGRRPGLPAYLWMAFIVVSACLAFIFAAGWLWAIAGVAGGLLFVVYSFGDEHITN